MPLKLYIPIYTFNYDKASYLYIYYHVRDIEYKNCGWMQYTPCEVADSKFTIVLCTGPGLLKWIKCSENNDVSAPSIFATKPNSRF